MPQAITRQKTVTKALVALGSNVSSAIGDSSQIVRAAFAALESDSVSVTAASPLYGTPCMPAGTGPDYINAAARVATTLSAQALLDHLHAVEYQFERTRELRWGSRTLDLDLLDFGESVAPDRETWQFWRDLAFERQLQEAPERLVLPHPRIQDRAFVLVPLKDVAANWVHPVTGQSVETMIANLPPEDLSAIERLENAEHLRSVSRDDK